MQPISQHQLNPGDILLCYVEKPGFAGYISALITLIKLRNHKNDDEEKDKDEKKAQSAALFTILRGLIVWFDQDDYSHAAFWDGEKVAEAGSSGVNRNDISHYKNTITHVYRWIKNDDYVLGRPDYPVQPLIDTSNHIVEQKLPYSYSTAYLYMFLCFTRWKREEWIALMKTFLQAHLAEFTHPFIEELFQKHAQKLHVFLEWLADDIIDKILSFRHDKGMVCSEFVAAVFNTSPPEGKYTIEKPLLTSANIHGANALLVTSENDIIDLQNFGELLVTTSFPATNSEKPILSDRISILYTPHDIARSVNTSYIGVLELTSNE